MGAWVASDVEWAGAGWAGGWVKGCHYGNLPATAPPPPPTYSLAIQAHSGQGHRHTGSPKGLVGEGMNVQQVDGTISKEGGREDERGGAT